MRIAKIFLGFALLSCLPLRAQSLRVGAAKVNISPTAEFFPHKDFHGGTYVGIHDSLYARAIFMTDGQTQALLVEMDEDMVFEPGKLLEEVCQNSGVPQEHIIICPNHTHSNLNGGHPDVDLIRAGVVCAVKKAQAQTTPAQVGFARTQTFVAVNNGEAVGKASNPEGFTDRTLDVVRFTSLTDGKPLAMVVNFASHAEVMFQSQIREKEFEISADLPGQVSTILEAEEAGAPVVLSTCGAEGDQLPILQSSRRYSNLKGRDLGQQGYVLLQALGAMVADDALRAAKSITYQTADLHLKAGSAKVSVPGQQYKRNRETGETTLEDTPDVQIPIAYIQLGNDIAFQGVGGDLAAEIGSAVRKASPIKNTMLITVMAGTVGYILPDAMYEHPTHGIMGSKVKPGYCKDAIIQGFNNLLK